MAVIKPVGFFFDVGAAAVALVGEIPDSGDFGTVWIEGVQAATNTDFATMDNYDGGGVPTLGLNLTDNATDFSHFVFLCAHGIVSAHNTGEGLMSLREDTGASDGTTPSAASGTTGTDMRTTDVGGPDANMHWSIATARVSNASKDEEWGAWFVEGTDIATFTVDGACMVALPAQNTPLNTDATYAGSHLIASKTYRDNPGTLDPVGITAADTDNPSAGVTVTIQESGEYLIFNAVRVEGVNNADNSGVGSLRWTVNDNGTDIYGVRTDTATGGAVRTGRGFQHNTHMLAAANKIRTAYCPFVVRNLNAAAHEFIMVGNKHDNGNDGTERLLHDGLIAIKTDQFDPFVCREDATALLVDFDSFTDWNDGVTVTGDGVKEFWIGFSTTLHTATAGTGMDFQFTANGSRLDTVAHARHDTFNNGDGTTGSADSDNCCLPVTYWFVDTPAVGAVTYKVQVRRSGGGSNPIINCNDNGASGYKGTMFAAGLSFTGSQ